MEARSDLSVEALSETLHIVVDLASAPQGLRLITGSTSHPFARSLFESARTVDADAVAPWLLTPPPELRELWLQRSKILAQERPAVLWLLGGPQVPDAVFRQLTQRLDVVLDDDTEMLLRFYDPRVFGELLACLEEDPLQAFLGAFRTWAYLNRDGVLCKVAPAASNQEDRYESPLRLSAQASAALLLSSEAGQVLNETLKRWPDDLQMLLKQQQFDLAKACCKHADTLDMDNLADKVLLLMWAAGQPTGYFDSKAWLIDRQRLKSGEQTLMSLLEAGV